MKQTKIFAHRGDSGAYPENTLLAFSQALTLPIDGIELDVHLSKDGQTVIIHDETVDRTTGGTGAVAEMTLSELQRLDASFLWRGTVPVQRVPTLAEYLELVKNCPITTNIELKTDRNPYPGIEECVWEQVCAFHLEDRVLFSSFNAESVQKMRAISGAPCGLLCDWKHPKPIKVIKNMGFQAYHPHYSGVNRLVMWQSGKTGIAVHTYTPNSRQEIAKMLRLGVNMLITNYPARALAQRLEIQGF